MTTKSLTLDIWQKNHAIVKANQGEVNSRFLEITLTDKSVPLDLTSKTVFFYATKPDGNVIFNSCEIENVKNGTVTVCLTSQMSAKPGIMPCEVHIIDNEKSILKAVGLELEIVKCADLEGAVESKSEFTALQGAMAEYESASEKFNFHLDSRNNPHEVTTAQIGAVPATRTINSKILNSDIELTPEDVGAAAKNHTHAASEITSGVLPIERGGTGAATKSEAQKSFQIYTDVTQLGLTYPCTMADILDVLPAGSIANFGFNMKSDGITDAPISFGGISIFYPSQARRLVFCTQCIASGGEFSNFYLGYYISSERTMNWYKIPNGSMVTSIANGGTGATTASAALANLGAVPQTRTINSKALNSDIELNCDDIGAATADHKHGAGDITSGTLPIARGGTGATTLIDAQKNLQFYNSYSQLGLSGGCTISDIMNSLPNYSIFNSSINGTSQVSDVPTDWGQLTIFKSRDRKIILFNQSLSGGNNGNNFYFGEHRNETVTWYKIFTSNPNCIVPIENGGTGAKTATEAQSALKIFTDISQLNLAYPCTTGDIVNAMPAGSIGFFNVEASSSTVTDVATGFSFLEIYKATQNRVRVLLNGSPSDGSSTGSTFSIGQYNAATRTIESWKRIQTSAFATPINCGGTGATTAFAAISNLGAVPQIRTINSKALSSNIELNCSDIGAAEENHVHEFSEIINTPTTLAGYGITDVLSNEHTHTFDSIEEKPTTLEGYGITDATRYEVKNGVDFNEMKTPGLYTMRSSTANAPTSGSYHSLIVNKSDNGNYVQQIAIKESTYEVYMRYLNGSSWSNWKQISMADHVQSIDKGGTGATTASAAISNLHGVEATTSAITYYISPSGSNSNSGKSSSSPFKTLAHALNKLPKFLKHDVTINVAQGTYTESEVLITGFVGEGSLSIVGTSAANAVGAENYIFSNGIKINKNQGRVELHGIGSSNGFRVYNSPDVVFYYCHAYSPSLVADRAGFFSTHSKVFTVYCRATNFQNGFHSYQGGDLTAMCGVCTNCSYPWCSAEGAILYVYGASSSGFTSAHNYSSAGVIVGSYGGTLGI